MSIPTHVRKLCNLLNSNKLEVIDLGIGNKIIHGKRGILNTSVILYNSKPNNILKRNLEYTFYLTEKQAIEISLQLYENASYHWRLFAYNKSGMLLSVNLTLLRKHGAEFNIYQTLKLSVQKMRQNERISRTAALRQTLQKMGFEIDDNNRLILGTFNSISGQFVDTSPRVFLRSFLTAALVKGHFMGNKGYSIPFLQRLRDIHFDDKKIFKGRSIPLGLRYQILEKYDFKCCACGHSPKDGIKLHADHIKPVSQGGVTSLANLQVLCTDCNLGKGNRSIRKI